MNKTNVIINGVVICGLLVLTFLHFNSRDKIVYVDNIKLISNYEGIKKARAEFEKKSKAWKANEDTLQKEFEVALKKYEKERTKISAREKQLTEELLRNKQNQYQQYRKAIEQKSQEEERKLSGTALQEIDNFLKEYGKKKGYFMILGATNGGNILYARPNTDITEELIKSLNENYIKNNK